MRFIHGLIVLGAMGCDVPLDLIDELGNPIPRPTPLAPPDCPIGNRAVFVAVDGGGDGTAADPLGDIQSGIDQVKTAGGGAVFVRAGTYPGTVRLPDGVRLVGGFDADWRPGLRRTVVEGAQDETGRAIGLIAEDIACAQLDRLHITTVHAGPGASSYGIVARRAGGLRLFDVTVEPGAAGDGRAGDPGRAGEDGGDGTDAILGAECWSPPVQGTGGENRACPAANGADGEPINTHPEGQMRTGATPLGVCQVENGPDNCPAPFSMAGADGASAVSRLDHPLVDGWWAPRDGQPGETGQVGEGGARLAPEYWPHYYLEAQLSVGGGGAGGCGGRGGQGGRGGGSAFGLFATHSAGLRIRRSTIRSGRAGRGGAGGIGGPGGAGGLGGDSLVCTLDACPHECEEPYDDNSGRPGGPGGSGGIGAAGVAIGARCWDGALDVDATSRFLGGSGGARADHLGCCVADAQAQAECPDQAWDAARCVCAPACAGGVEVCNGEDDDCDGRVDETHLSPERVLTSVRHWHGPYFDVCAWGDRIGLAVPSNRTHQLIELTAEGEFIRGTMLRASPPIWASWISCAMGPGGAGLQIEYDFGRTRYGLTTDDTHSHGLLDWANHRSTRVAPDGRIDALAVGPGLGREPQFYWTRFDTDLSILFEDNIATPPGAVDDAIASIAIGDTAHFFALDADALRWGSGSLAGGFELRRIPLDQAIRDLHAVALPDQSVGLVYTTIADEARSVLARVSADGLDELAVFAAGEIVAVLPTPEGALIAQRNNGTITALLAGPDGAGTRRTLTSLPNARQLHLLAVGEAHALFYERDGQILMRHGTLCLPADADSDGDGLSDREEQTTYHTDPARPDSDDDGCPDGFEVEHQLDPLTADLHRDADRDGRDNGAECVRGTDPFNPDTDGDGLDDGAEHAAGSSPFTGDTDADGLGDFDEVRRHQSDPTRIDSDDDGLDDNVEVNTHGTDPSRADTDGDGIDDAAELRNGLDPLVPNRDDLDADGLSDLDEVIRGTNPLNADTDQDELPDAEELMRGTDPLNADTDGDGALDGLELREGLDPLNTDTDGDGWSDGFELSVRSDPRVFDGPDADNDNDGLTNQEEFDRNLRLNDPDYDDDGLLDGAEIERGSDPRRPDTDGDNLLDGAEVHTHNTDPTRADTDGGGAPDDAELRAGTDPNAADDEPIFAADVCPPGAFSCGDGVCVVDALRCDLGIDCANAADENDCAACPAGSFQCQSPPGWIGPRGDIDHRLQREYCVPDARRCDRRADCGGATDEIGCVCTPDEVNCGGPEQDGPCLSIVFQGDGECDCPAGRHCADE